MSGENRSKSSDTSDQGSHSQDKPNGLARADWKQVFLLGLAMKLGGCSMAWNYGLITGFWEYFIAVMVVGIGYLMLGLCMAEMVSIMTFDGGYYGYARVILGPLGGYLVGCSGLMESIFYFADYPMKIAQFLEVCFNINSGANQLIWLITYVVLVILMVLCCRYFWQIISIYTMMVIVLMLIYLFGSIPSLNFQHYALINHSVGFHNDPNLFLDIFRLSVVFFIGFDLLTLITSEVKESKKTMPYAMLGLIVTMLVLALWLMFTVASQPPGVTEQLYQESTYFPLVFGYMRIFNIGYKSASAIAAFPMMGTSVVYMYIIARQIKSMASSGLLPHALNCTINLQGEDVPVVAYLVVCLIAYAANYFALTVNIYTTCTRAATTAGCFVYLSMFYCYVVFKKRFCHCERTLKNPLGIFSAVIGSVIFGTILVMMLVFHPEFKAVPILYAIFMTVMLIYYYVYAETRQYFSSSEQKVFFKAYIVNFHMRKKKTPYQRFMEDLTRLIYSLCSIAHCSSAAAEYCSPNISSKSSGLSCVKSSTVYVSSEFPDKEAPSPELANDQVKTNTETSIHTSDRFTSIYRIAPPSYEDDQKVNEVVDSFPRQISASYYEASNVSSDITLHEERTEHVHSSS